jgi:hypothetical protein
MAAKDAGEELDTDVDLLIVRGAVLSLLWDRGDFESVFLPDPEDAEGLKDTGKSKADATKEVKRFWSIIKDEAKKYTPPPEEAEEAAAEEPAPAEAAK